MLKMELQFNQKNWGGGGVSLLVLHLEANSTPPLFQHSVTLSGSTLPSYENLNLNTRCTSIIWLQMKAFTLVLMMSLSG